MADVTKIRVELSKMNCRVHLKLPRITKIGDVLHYDTCCDDFEKKLEARFQELLQEPSFKVPGRRV
jgi:hypothetical protein